LAESVAGAQCIIAISNISCVRPGDPDVLLELIVGRTARTCTVYPRHFQYFMCPTRWPRRTVGTDTLYDSAEPIGLVQCIRAISSISCVRPSDPGELLELIHCTIRQNHWDMYSVFQLKCIRPTRTSCFLGGEPRVIPPCICIYTYWACSGHSPGIYWRFSSSNA
jgi:hypothetical protein